MIMICYTMMITVMTMIMGYGLAIPKKDAEKIEFSLTNGRMVGFRRNLPVKW